MFFVQLPLIIIEIAMYFRNELLFNGVFKRYNLLEIKDGVYVINPNDKKVWNTLDFITYWQKCSCVLWFVFGIEYIPRDVSNKIKNKSIAHNIFRMQSDNSIMGRFCFISFIQFMIVGKIFLDYTDLFPPNAFKRDGKIIYKHFKMSWWVKSIKRWVRLSVILNTHLF